MKTSSRIYFHLCVKFTKKKKTQQKTNKETKNSPLGMEMQAERRVREERHTHVASDQSWREVQT